MKYTCEKCGEQFDTERACKLHEEKHRIQDTPALCERCAIELEVSLTEHPEEGDGKYTLTYPSGSNVTTSGHPEFYSNIKNMDKLVGKKIRVHCYAEIIE